MPGLRGSLLDRRGNALAASEDAATIFATPYQVKNPPRRPKSWRRSSRLDQGEVLREPHRRIRLLLHRPESQPRTGGRIERLELEGIGELPDSRRTYPQGEMAGQVIGAVGSENQGLTGLEQGEDDVLPAATANAHRHATRSATRSGSKPRRKPRTAKTSS